MAKPKFQAVVQKGNKFCGPAAISALTGVPTNHAAEIVRSNNPNRLRVKGVSTLDILDALASCGLSWKQGPQGIRIGRLAEQPGVHLVIYVHSPGRSHCAVVQGGKIVDSGCISKVPVPIPDTVSLKPVTRCYEVIEGIGCPPPPKPKKQASNYWKRKTKALATKYNIDIEDINGTIWVYRPASFPIDKDTYDAQHYHDDWESAFKAVTLYSLEFQEC